MADNNNKTIQIDISKLPPNVDPTKIAELLAKAQKTNDRAKLYGEVSRKARAELAKNHKDEYEKLLAKYKKELKVE